MKKQLIMMIAAGAALVLPQVAEAQLGPIELGVFGRYAIYDGDVGIDAAPGIGGRVGVFFHPNFSIEAEASYAEPAISDGVGWQGRTFISHVLYQGRLLYSHSMSEKTSLLLGAGVAYDHYFRPRNLGVRGAGPSALVGLRYAFNDMFTGRIEGTGYMISEKDDAFPAPRPGTMNLGLQAGISLLFRDRVEERIVQLPAPPPDTVRITTQVQAPLPEGTATQICLSTGQSTTVYITPQGDTLVGANRIAVSALGAGVGFAGEYADGRDWYVADSPIPFQQREYRRSGGNVSLNCANIRQVGEHLGVPLFADTNAQAPFATIYVPVRPGVWQAYQTDLAAVRG